MFQYLYLWLALAMCGLALAGLLWRRDLWPTVIGIGIAGGALEVLAEIWYLHDYWHPPTVLGFPAPEDFLYGLGTTTLSVCVVPLVLRRRYEAGPPAIPFPKSMTVVLLAAFCGYMQISRHTGPPSIWAAAAGFAIVGALACALRPSLVGPSLLAAIFMGAVAAVGYGLGLNFVIDGKMFLARVWLLHGTRWDIRVLSNVPLDEIVWNITRGFCMATLYPLLAGKRLQPMR